jgi:cell division protein FtsZ
MNGIKKEQIVADLSRSLMEPKITIVGCGGAGNNIVNGLYWSNKNVNTVAINTDEAKLQEIEVHTKVLIGTDVTFGRGTNGLPEVGEHCAELARGAISKVLRGSDIVFIVAGMGGGTGTGAAPVVAEVARELDAITFIIAINPFAHEGARREIAQEGIRRLKQTTSNVIVLENDRLLNLAGDCTISESFAIIERSISSLIGSLSERITRVLQEQIRQEVSEALMEMETVRVARPASVVVPEIIRAKSVAASLEMPFGPSVAPQFLTR